MSLVPMLTVIFIVTISLLVTKIAAACILTVVASSNKVDIALTKLINKVLSRFKNYAMHDNGSLYKLADNYHLLVQLHRILYFRKMTP